MASDRRPTRRVVLHPSTAAARQLDRSRSTGSRVRGHTVAADEVFEIVATERRAALRAALLVILPIFALPVLFLGLQQLSIDLPAILPWLILGPVTLSALVVVGVVHDRRVSKRERIRSATYADPGPGRPGVP